MPLAHALQYLHCHLVESGAECLPSAGPVHDLRAKLAAMKQRIQEEPDDE
jgi:hypothetical protein